MDFTAVFQLNCGENMGHVSNEPQGTTLKLTIKGQIDEHFIVRVDPSPKFREVHVYCGDVPSLNSEGIRLWIGGFNQIVKNGFKLKFFECSPQIVSKISEIGNFLGGGELVSLQIPYACGQCSETKNASISLADLRKIYPKLKAPACPKDGSTMEFDEIESEYFAFLTRNTQLK